MLPTMLQLLIVSVCCPQPNFALFVTATLSSSSSTTQNDASDGLDSANGSQLAARVPSASSQLETAPDNAEPADFDDRTLLDLFGEAAKEYLTQKIIPQTDVECRWDWRYVRCEPYCDCTFSPMRGDYHLGRSCRRRTGDHVLPYCDDQSTPTEYTTTQLVIQSAVVKSQSALKSVSTRTKKGYRKVQESVCRELPVVDCSRDPGPQVAWQQQLFCSKMIPKCNDNHTETVFVESVEETAVPENESFATHSAGQGQENATAYPTDVSVDGSNDTTLPTDSVPATVATATTVDSRDGVVQEDPMDSIDKGQ